jgi:hypothetical protein
MDAPLVIRSALRSDLPQLPALYLHLDPEDQIPSLDVAERGFADLQKYHGSDFHGHRRRCHHCLVHVGGNSQPCARRSALWD